MMRQTPFWIAAALFASFFSVVAQAAAPVQVELEPGDAEGAVRFSITNTSELPVSILQWDTPLERTLSSDVFRLQRRVKDWPLVELAPYIGRDVKRAQPGADQYLTLNAGETVSREIDLHDYYEVSEPGPWNVRFLGRIRLNQPEIATQGSRTRKALNYPPVLNVATYESNSVTLTIVPGDSFRARIPAFNSCSVEHQADVVAALALAEDYVSIAAGDLQSLSPEQRQTSPRYVTWFGAYDQTRFDLVSSNYQTIGNVLENEEIRFDCGCNETGVFAYVVPIRPYDIFLCPEFRAASIGGTDSRAGTIIHELTHFNVVAGTEDHVYSQRGAQSLASSDPATAIANADNYEYFAENTPVLDIRSTATPSPTTEFSELTLNVPVIGSVDAGNSVTFQVSDASQIILTTASGDADLYLYSDAALTAEICSSVSATSQDVCENFFDGLVYVRIFGYTAATFILEATGGTTDTPQASSIARLVPGTTAFGSLQKDERAVYQVSGSRQVELESLTGDADLYVFDSLEFVESTFVCSSAAYSSASTLDRCELPTPAETYFLMVVGFEASDYSLSASEADSLPEDDDPATLSQTATANQSPFSTSVSLGGGGGSLGWWGTGLLMLGACVSSACVSSACVSSAFVKAAPMKLASGKAILMAGIAPADDTIPSSDIKFHLDNHSDAAVTFLIWNTPFERILSADVFTVTLDSVPIPYQGRMMKRSTPAAQDYMDIPAGERIDVLVDIADYYDLSAAGEYEVSFTPSLLNARAHLNEQTPVQVEGSTITLNIARK